MPANFQDYNFQIIDLTVCSISEMFVNQSGLTFSKGVVEEMSYPLYVRAMFSPEKKAFSLQRCKAAEPKAIKFIKEKHGKSATVSINIKAIYNTIWRMMQGTWEKGTRYKITGIYFPDAKAMVFDLASAESMPTFRATSKKVN